MAFVWNDGTPDEVYTQSEKLSKQIMEFYTAERLSEQQLLMQIKKLPQSAKNYMLVDLIGRQMENLDNRRNRSRLVREFFDGPYSQAYKNTIKLFLDGGVDPRPLWDGRFVAEKFFGGTRRELRHYVSFYNSHLRPLAKQAVREREDRRREVARALTLGTGGLPDDLARKVAMSFRRKSRRRKSRKRRSRRRRSRRRKRKSPRRKSRKRKSRRRRKSR
jgi:hypothetical protein